MTPAQRLKEARERAGYATAKDAAIAMGVSISTYIQHENGARGLPATRASRYGRFFRADPSWLLYGRQPQATSVQSRGVLKLIAIVGVGSRLQYRAGLGSVVVPEDVGTTPVAALVEADSLGPIFAGWVIVWDAEEQNPPSELDHDKLCVASLTNGEVYVRLLKPSATPGRYHLISNNTDPPIFDAEVMWASRVLAIAPRP